MPILPAALDELTSDRDSHQSTYTKKQGYPIEPQSSAKNEGIHEGGATIEVNEFTKATIIYLKIRNAKDNRTLDLNSLNQLKRNYEKFKHNQRLRELFLDIPSTLVEDAKQFLIEKNDIDTLKMLFNKFKQLKLTKSEICKLYEKYKDYLTDLERTGVRIALSFDLMTLDTAAYFNEILNSNRVNGYHTGYASNIFHQMILPILDRLAAQNQTSQLNYHPRALLKLIGRLMQFCSLHSVGLSINQQQLQTLLRLIESQFNLKQPVTDNLSTGIIALTNLVKAAGLDIIKSDNKLLLLNTRTESCCEITLQHSQKIVELMQINLQQTENENLFMSKCKKVANNLSMRPQFIAQYNIFTPIKINQLNTLEEAIALVQLPKFKEAPF